MNTQLSERSEAILAKIRIKLQENKAMRLTNSFATDTGKKPKAKTEPSFMPAAGSVAANSVRVSCQAAGIKTNGKNPVPTQAEAIKSTNDLIERIDKHLAQTSK